MSNKERDEWKARAEKAEADCSAWAKDYMERGTNLSLTLERAQTAEIKVMDAEKVLRVLTQQLESALAENEALKARVEELKRAIVNQEALLNNWKARAEKTEANLDAVIAEFAAAQHQAPDVGAQCTEEDLIAFHMAYEECNSAEYYPAWRAGITAVLQRRQALGAAQQGEPSDEQVEAAARVLPGVRWQFITDHGKKYWCDLARSILRAAQITAPAVEGEKATPSPDPLPVEQIAAVLELHQ